MRLGIFIPTFFRDYDRVQSALWIRALQMIEPLRAAGCEVHLNNPLRRYDAVVYHRGMRRRSLRFVRFLRTISRRVYWDTCVDYFDRHEASDEEQVACARAIAGHADGVCVTTEGIVITSYSIHYTKLYEFACSAKEAARASPCSSAPAPTRRPRVR